MNATVGTASAVRVSPPSSGGDRRGAPPSRAPPSDGPPSGEGAAAPPSPSPGGAAAPAARRDPKRQRTASEQVCRPVMPLRLCIPMLVVAVTAGLSDLGAEAADMARVYHSARRPVAGVRPASAPDVDYGGVHPFDERRHEYDPAFARRMRRGGRGAAGGGSGGLRSDADGRGLKKEDGKQKEKDKWSDNQRPLQTSEPTARPTGEPPSPPSAQQQTSGLDVGQSGPAGADTSSLSQVYKVPATAGGLGSSSARQSASASAPSVPSDVTTLNPLNDHLYKPMRILFDTRQIAERLDSALASGDTASATRLYLLMYEVLPMTARTWGDILRVVPVVGGIYPLAARGSGVDQLLPNGENQEGDDAAGRRGIDDDPVRALYCPEDTTSGIEGGGDLLVYATVNRQCENALGSGGSTGRRLTEEERDSELDRRFSFVGGSDLTDEERRLKARLGTLASALPCQRDQYDRPITGSIDFCLDGMKDVTAMNVAKAVARKEAAGIVFRNHMVGSAHATDKWDGWASAEDDGAEAEVSRRRDQVNMDGGEGQMESNRNTIQYSVGVAVHGEFLESHIGLL